MVARIKAFVAKYQHELYIALVIVLVAFLCFGLGRLSVIYGTNNQFSVLPPGASNMAGLPPAPEGGGGYVASKNGTAYHFPWCPGALTMKEENKIYFETKEEAEKAGYKPAGNCKGL